MSRYIQKISFGYGKTRWIGWEIDGIGTEIPGLTLADDLDDEELKNRGVKKFVPMAFEDFVGLGTALSARPDRLPDEDIVFRLDALQVGIERLYTKGFRQIPKAMIKQIFSGVSLADERIQARLLDWETAGRVQVIGTDECYLRILKPW